jgi:hypothetical protein
MEIEQQSECEYYPVFGVAPHECYWRKPGGFDNPLGTSTINPLESWPDGFYAEIDTSKPVSGQLNWGLCGVYVCPCGCCDSFVSDRGVASANGTVLMSKAEIAEAITKEGHSA